jgi:acyl carrier protein
MNARPAPDSTTIEELLNVLDRALALGDRVRRFGPETALLGALPEFDSMAVVAVITGIEDHFGIVVADDEISGETFETVGSLARFVDEKLGLESR